MSLPVPSLDDRRFQDIVDEAKRLITRYCPEWTDHNVSDPGVTLIELFAWMTEMLLYRVNQVPDKMYIKFLELIGIQLSPPRPATAEVTFYLSAPQAIEVVIPAETEVATIRTETSPATIFTTERPLPIRPARLVGALTRDASLPEESSWLNHDLRQLGLPGRRVPMFPNPAAPGDALYFALEQDHSHHVLALVVACEIAGGAGVDPTDPPLEWQVWQGGLARWATCEVEYDGTGGFNWSGEIILHLPPMSAAEFQGRRAYWLRCRLTDAQAGATGYRQTPTLERIAVESRGGTVPARHATTVMNEYLGESDGSPGQSFRLLHTPVLARDPRTDFLFAAPPAGQRRREDQDRFAKGVIPEAWRWSERSDLAESRPDDRHYRLDSLDGSIQFGPTLLQPNGQVYIFGATPPKGSELYFHRYQHGGGVSGNVPAGALSVAKTSIPYVARVANRRPATGGMDAQNLEDAKVRAPLHLRTRTRAVTSDDFEFLALEVPGVARAYCRAPGSQPAAQGEPRPGQVVVYILPDIDRQEKERVSVPIPADRLTLSAELRSGVLTMLNQRKLVGTSVEVTPAQVLQVAVRARLRARAGADADLVAYVQARAEEALYRYLNPFFGGPAGAGWPFGRDLNVSELLGRLQAVADVDYVEEIQVQLVEGGGPRPVTARLTVPVGAVIVSGQHTVTVE